MTSTPLELPTQLDPVAFISAEAHDLRSPFNQIIGFSRIMMNGISATYTAEMQKEDAGAIYRSGQRALLLMNGLIDIARLTRHEKEAAPAELEIQPLLDQIRAQWRKLNPTSPLQIDFQITASSACLSADEILLRQILLGFILYVSHYVAAEGKVTIVIEEEPGWVLLKVASAGKKALPLSQLDLQMQGYVGRALVELQHGEIRLAEETDAGAVIQFALPQG